MVANFHTKYRVSVNLFEKLKKISILFSSRNSFVAYNGRNMFILFMVLVIFRHLNICMVVFAVWASIYGFSMNKLAQSDMQKYMYKNNTPAKKNRHWMLKIHKMNENVKPNGTEYLFWHNFNAHWVFSSLFYNFHLQHSRLETKRRSTKY